MMEIVQDLAPEAQLFYATAQPPEGESQFALNIIALYNHGCLIIGDDVSYSDEDPFQDGVLGQAINTFVGAGGIYFSSAANSGNLTNGTSTTWEGDFTDGPTITLGVGGTVVLHDFGGGNIGNLMLNAAPTLDLVGPLPRCHYKLLRFVHFGHHGVSRKRGCAEWAERRGSVPGGERFRRQLQFAGGGRYDCDCAEH
jgi:hypothetical protein